MLRSNSKESGKSIPEWDQHSVEYYYYYYYYYTRLRPIFQDNLGKPVPER